MGSMDDECHLVFECLVLEQPCLYRPHLFTDVHEPNVKAFLAQQDERGAFRYVLDRLKTVAASSDQED